MLESEFCELKGVSLIIQTVIFEAQFIKKQHYWPNYVTVDATYHHMDHNSVGGFEVLNRIIYFKEFNIFTMKQSNCFMIIMSSYSNLEEGLPANNQVKDPITGKHNNVSSQYTHIFDKQFIFRYKVYNNNKHQVHLIVLEDTCTMSNCQDRFFYVCSFAESFQHPISLQIILRRT